ncbi:hypothetical protein Bbelb_252850 [Branchiostoma belcheri]|nr:hypothetical protein Bbelb_252850 [Branchiostoma belcheri]
MARNNNNVQCAACSLQSKRRTCNNGVTDRIVLTVSTISMHRTTHRVKLTAELTTSSSTMCQAAVGGKGRTVSSLQTPLISDGHDCTGGLVSCRSRRVDPGTVSGLQRPLPATGGHASFKSSAAELVVWNREASECRHVSSLQGPLPETGGQASFQASVPPAAGQLRRSASRIGFTGIPGTALAPTTSGGGTPQHRRHPATRPAAPVLRPPHTTGRQRLATPGAADLEIWRLQRIAGRQSRQACLE